MAATAEDGDLAAQLRRWQRPLAVAAFAYAVCSAVHGPWLASSLLCLCGLSVSGARLLSAEVARRWQSRDQPAATGQAARDRCRHVSVALLVIVALQMLVSSETLWAVLSHWYLALVVPLLALALHAIGSPRFLLEEKLHHTQVSYAQGAAWAFFIGYLTKLFDITGSGKPKIVTFKDCMADYLTKNNINDDDQSITCKNRLLILVPMKHELTMSDRSISDHDDTIEQEGVSSLVASRLPSGGISLNETFLRDILYIPAVQHST